MKHEVITTKDGSSSLFVPALNETYHSIHGAINEALHVFINKGLTIKKHLPNLRILEVGFGTGLNCLLTLNKANKEQLEVDYFGLEKYPLDTKIIEQINYGKTLNCQKEFLALHDFPWEIKNQVSPNFSLTKLQFDLIDQSLAGSYDLVYFDAFAPNKQPEMWESSVLQKIHDAMNPDALLVTYCCQGKVKRTLQSIGFQVQKTDGPPGKREMLTATKTIEI